MFAEVVCSVLGTWYKALESSRSHGALLGHQSTDSVLAGTCV